MDLFIDGEFEDNEELNEVLQQINPSEDESPESVASKTNQIGEGLQQDPTPGEELEESDDDDDDEEGDGIKSPKTSLYSSLANVLYNEGVLPNLDLKDAKIESVDDLVEAIKNEISANEFSGLNDRQKRYLEAIKEGIPEDLFLDAEKVNYTLDSLTDEVLEDEENISIRTDIIKEYFMLKGMDEAEADKLTQQQVDLAEDIEFSKKAVNVLKQYNQHRLDKEAEYIKEQHKARDEDFNKLKNVIQSTNKVIEGKPIDKKTKDAILDMIIKPVATLEDGTPVNQLTKYQLEDPIDFQYKLAYIAHMTNGFKDFSAFTTVKKAKNQAVRELEDVLQKSVLDLSGESFDPNSLDLGSDFMIDI